MEKFVCEDLDRICIVIHQVIKTGISTLQDAMQFHVEL